MAHPDLDKLLSVLLAFAKQTLSKRGVFYPFGATLKVDGDLTMASSYDGRETPPAQEILLELTDNMRAQATVGEITAAGVCVDVRISRPGVSTKTDAIHCGLEHSSGELVDVYVPYRKSWLRGMQYDEVFASARDPKIFLKT